MDRERRVLMSRALPPGEPSDLERCFRLYVEGDIAVIGIESLPGKEREELACRARKCVEVIVAKFRAHSLDDPVGPLSQEVHVYIELFALERNEIAAKKSDTWIDI